MSLLALLRRLASSVLGRPTPARAEDGLGRSACCTPHHLLPPEEDAGTDAPTPDSSPGER